nr:transcription factor gte12 [Ipomoea batatas]
MTLGLPKLKIRINLESKKRCFDDDSKVEKRRWRIERVLPAPPTVIHRGGWDCQKKPRSPENWERGCLRNRGGRDLRKENLRIMKVVGEEGIVEIRRTLVRRKRSHCRRKRKMKKRYAHLIFKATHQPLLMTLGDPLKQQQERERLEMAEKAKIEEEIKAAQTLVRMRAEADLKIQREAARIALENMEKTVEFNDAWQIL